MLERLLLIGAGGFAGAIARYLVSTRGVALLGIQTFYGTMLVNVTGSFLLGAFIAWADSRGAFPQNIRLLIVTGFFGAYTTFSTYALEGVLLGRGGRWLEMIAYVVATNTLCLLGALLGWYLIGRITTGG